jgi:hypothetical protein
MTSFRSDAAPRSGSAKAIATGVALGVVVAIPCIPVGLVLGAIGSLAFADMDMWGTELDQSTGDQLLGVGFIVTGFLIGVVTPVAVALRTWWRARTSS